MILILALAYLAGACYNSSQGKVGDKGQEMNDEQRAVANALERIANDIDSGRCKLLSWDGVAHVKEVVDGSPFIRSVLTGERKITLKLDYGNKEQSDE